MNKSKRIFIIGHPGAGKGLLAKAIAEKLGWQFIDTDFGLEFRVGRTLAEIIGKQGEKKFYDCQGQILTSLFDKENIVVTTDASIVYSEENRKLLSAEFVVYLKVSTKVQLERTSRHPTPLLPITDLKTFLDKLHQERDHIYDQVASLSINSDDNALEKHMLTVVKALESKNIKQELDNLPLEKKDVIIFHKTQHIPIHLSDQQAVCLKLLIQGKTSKEIAREMNISYRTVEGYIAKMIEQLGCTSSKELIALYYDQA